MTAHRFYVYVAFRPWNGTPCYVGKGQGGRWTEHARLGKNHYNRHIAAILNRANGDLPIVIIRDGLTNAEAIAGEIALIAAIGRADQGTGPLANWTDGGEGTSGHRHSAQARERIAAALTGRVVSDTTRKKMSENATRRQLGKKKGPMSPAHRAAIGAANVGKKRPALSAAKRGHDVSSETRKKIADALKGRSLTDAHRSKISEALKASPRAAAHIAELGRKNKGKPLTLAHREKVRQANLGAKRSEKARVAMSARQRRRKHGPMSEEALERRRAKMAGYVMSEETRRKISEAAKAQHARNRALRDIERESPELLTAAGKAELERVKVA